MVAPTEEFWTFLGIDQAIAVEYKQIRRFEEDILKKKRVLWEYQTVITNNKKTKEELVMWDQVPISGTEEITVETIEPPLKENTAVVKVNEQQFVEWFFALEPGKKVAVPFSFAVRYPKERSVDGL